MRNGQLRRRRPHKHTALRIQRISSEAGEGQSRPNRWTDPCRLHCHRELSFGKKRAQARNGSRGWGGGSGSGGGLKGTRHPAGVGVWGGVVGEGLKLGGWGWLGVGCWSPGSGLLSPVLSNVGQCHAFDFASCFDPGSITVSWMDLQHGDSVLDPHGSKTHRREHKPWILHVSRPWIRSSKCQRKQLN